MPNQSDEQTRREFLRRAGGVAAGIAIGGRIPSFAATPRRKPNVVFIFADQLRSQALGCYGDTQARTPNLDRMAAQGARFTNAISTWPVCSPFRAMLLTGRYPMSNGVIGNDYPIWDGQQTVATVLKAQGYQTGYIGKWHLNGGGPKVPENRRQGFDYWVAAGGQMLSDSPGGKQIWRPEVQTDQAISYIKEHRGKPFCLFMSWNPPHNPYIAPDRYMKLFPQSKMRLRPNLAESELVQHELKSHPVDPNSTVGQQRTSWRKRMDSDDGVREIVAGYYAATAGLDVCIGRVMKTLDEAGIADDTILVFTSDHGDMLGSHRMCLKQEPFEESISIPFIVRYPRRVRVKTVTDTLLSPIDMVPTVLGLANVSRPGSMEGLSLADAAMGKRSDQQDALLIMKMIPGGNPWAINAATPWRGVRTKTYTYARLLDSGPWILYDNQHDPYQMHNLANDPKHRALRDQMEAKMQGLLKKAHDPCDTTALMDTIRKENKKRGLRVPGGGQAGE